MEDFEFGGRERKKIQKMLTQKGAVLPETASVK